MTEKRAEIVDVLLWEICKTAADAAKEFDRTMDYAKASIAALKELDASISQWQTVSGVAGKTRRGPVGRILFLAPFNYPLNEMYAMLIPALLCGNVVTMKLPTIGGQCHLLTVDAFATCLPPGVVNFVSGSGRKCCPPIMKSGLVDMLGFIGGSKACDALIGDHPRPHRLKVFSQLEGKNMGIVLKDADLDVAADQCCAGSTSYNGQRCTAIKLVYVHKSVAGAFLDKFKAKVAAKKVGLPWAEGVALTLLWHRPDGACLSARCAHSGRRGCRRSVFSSSLPWSSCTASRCWRWCSTCSSCPWRSSTGSRGGPRQSPRLLVQAQARLLALWRTSLRGRRAVQARLSVPR